jgi:hypothetical protein
MRDQEKQLHNSNDANRQPHVNIIFCFIGS